MTNYIAISFPGAYPKGVREPLKNRLPDIPERYWIGDQIVVEYLYSLPKVGRLFSKSLYLKKLVPFTPEASEFTDPLPDDFRPAFIEDWAEFREEIRAACFAAFVDDFTSPENAEEANLLKEGRGDFAKFAKVTSMSEELFNLARLWLPDGGKSTPQIAPPRDPGGFEAASDYDEAALPKRNWLMENLLHRKLMTLVIAAGGTGKSTLLQQIGMAVAAGRDLGPFKIHDQTNVLLMNREDDVIEQRKRQSAARKLMGVTAEELNGRLFYWNPTSAPLMTAIVEDDVRKVVEHSWAKELRRRLKDDNIGLLILDPLIKFHANLDENSNDDRERVARVALSIANEANVAVLISHHAHKGARADQDASRGGSSLMDAARAAFFMHANDKGVVELTCVKLTMGRRPEPSEWQFVEFELANGEFSAALKPIAFDPFAEVYHTVIMELITTGRPNGQPWCSGRNGPRESRLDPMLDERFGLPEGTGLGILDKYVEAGLISQVDLKTKRPNGGGTMKLQVWQISAGQGAQEANPTQAIGSAAVVPSL